MDNEAQVGSLLGGEAVAGDTALTDLYDRAEIAAQQRYARQHIGGYGRRLMGKGEEARLALAHVLGSIESGVSIAEIERATAMIKAHLGHGDPK